MLSVFAKKTSYIKNNIAKDQTGNYIIFWNSQFVTFNMLKQAHAIVEHDQFTKYKFD